MQTEDRPKQWEKGIFHRGELKDYLKIMTDEEAEVLFCLKENKDIPTFVHTIALSASIGEKLKKNESKTIKIPVIQHKYRTERNKRIRKSLSDALKIGFFGKPEEKQTSINNECNLQTGNEIKTHEDYQKIVDDLLSKYGKDWEHQHKRNLDEARDVSND